MLTEFTSRIQLYLIENLVYKSYFHVYKTAHVQKGLRVHARFLVAHFSGDTSLLDTSIVNKALPF